MRGVIFISVVTADRYATPRRGIETLRKQLDNVFRFLAGLLAYLTLLALALNISQ